MVGCEVDLLTIGELFKIVWGPKGKAFTEAGAGKERTKRKETTEYENQDEKNGYATPADVDRSVRNDMGWWITMAGFDSRRMEKFLRCRLERTASDSANARYFGITADTALTTAKGSNSRMSIQFRGQLTSVDLRQPQCGCHAADEALGP